MAEHKCKRSELKWETEPEFDGTNTISYKGTCPECGKVWEQVFTEVTDGLWDDEAQEYVNI